MPWGLTVLPSFESGTSTVLCLDGSLTIEEVHLNIEESEEGQQKNERGKMPRGTRFLFSAWHSSVLGTLYFTPQKSYGMDTVLINL